MFYMYTDEAIKSGYLSDRVFVIVRADKSASPPFQMLHSALKCKITSKGITVPWDEIIKSAGKEVVGKLSKTFKIQKSLKSYSHEGFFVQFFNFDGQPNHFKLVSEIEIADYIRAKARVKTLLKTLSKLELKALVAEFNSSKAK